MGRLILFPFFYQKFHSNNNYLAKVVNIIQEICSMVTRLHSSLCSHFSRETKQEDIGGFSFQSSLWGKKKKKHNAIMCHLHLWSQNRNRWSYYLQKKEVNMEQWGEKMYGEEIKGKWRRKIYSLWLSIVTMKSPQHFINNKCLENGYKIIWIIKCCHMLFKILEYLLKCDKLYFFKFNPHKREI